MILSSFFIVNILLLCLGYPTYSLLYKHSKLYHQQKIDRWSYHRSFQMSLTSGSLRTKPFTAMMLVPTGVGAKIGGYAGDALPSARLLASAVDILITHPNVMNGAMLYWPMPNILYVEGNALNEFANNNLYLEPIKGGQKIGLLLDAGIEESLLLRHLQVADAYRATLGIDVSQAVVTSKPLGIETKFSCATGASWGRIKNIETLIEAAEELKNKGCTAIAVVARFPEIEDNINSENTENQHLEGNSKEFFDAYRKGEGVDAIAGVEALISHLVSQHVGLPCAHAPAFAPMEVDPEVSPKACAEELGYTFLPCVLSYLQATPHLHPTKNQYERIPSHWLSHKDVDIVVAPYNALGGPAVLSMLAQGKEILAILDNETTMKVTKQQFPEKYHSQIIEVQSYFEAAGYLLARRQGLLPSSTKPIIDNIPLTKLGQ